MERVVINVDKSVALYRAIAEGNEERAYEMTHASSLGMCPRAQFYKFMALPETTDKPTGAKVIRWGAGHKLEAEIRPSIEKVYGGLASNERMTSTKWMLTGEFDNLVLADNKLVEIKSVSDFAFIQRDNQLSLKQSTGQLNKWGKPVYEPKPTPYLHHEMQNHAYVLLLEEQGKTVEEIDYVYIGLGGRLMVYSTKVQPEIMEKVKIRLEALKSAYSTKEPPACVCLKGHPLFDGVMQYCPYQQEGQPCCNLELLK